MIIDLPIWKPWGRITMHVDTRCRWWYSCISNTRKKGRQRQGFPWISVWLQYDKLTLRIPQSRFSVFFTCFTGSKWAGSRGLSWSRDHVSQLLFGAALEQRTKVSLLMKQKNNDLNPSPPGGGRDRVKKALIFFGSQRARRAPGQAGPAAGGLTWCLSRLAPSPLKRRSETCVVLPVEAVPLHRSN